MGRFVKILVFFLIVAVAGYKLYSRFVPQGVTDSPHGMMAGGSPPSVDVAAVIEKDVRLWSEFSGRLTAVDRAEVKPRISGIIEAVHFSNGAAVNKGDLLFTIDPRPYEAALDRANAAFMQAQARADLASAEFRRAEVLFKSKAISKSDYEQRLSAQDAAEADLESTAAAIELAQIDLDYTQIRAPIAGRAGRAEITEGNLVEAGFNAPILTTIVADDRIYADFEMDEASFLRYYGTANHAGDIPVMMGLSAEEGTPHTGRIDSFDNSVDTLSGTIRVRALFDNTSGRLVPGLFARIRIGSREDSSVLLIADKAIGTDQDKKFVLALGEGNKVEYRVIKPGPLVDGLRVVEKGLAAGDQVIVNGIQRARPGMPVTPQFVTMNRDASSPAPGTP